MKIRKHRGGAGVGPYFWENDGDVVQVHTEMAEQLLQHPGFEYAGEDDAPEEPSAGDGEGEGEDPADGGETPEDEQVPDGTVNTIMRWVGDSEDRAKAAIEAERAKLEPRQSLIKLLSGMVKE